MASEDCLDTNLTPDRLESGMPVSRSGALAQLLVDLFSKASRISAFARSFKAMEALVKDLPGDTVPVSEMACSLAALLEEHGLVTTEFFEELVKRRRPQHENIRRVAEVWAITLGRSIPTGPRGLRSGPAKLALGLCTGLILIGGLALTWASLKEPQQAPPIEPVRVVALSPSELDPIIITVVSALTGDSWVVSLSKHRTAEAAARDIFGVLRLSDDRSMVEMFQREEFRLCQAEKCHTGEAVGTVIDVSLPVSVERRQRDFTSVRKASPP